MTESLLLGISLQELKVEGLAVSSEAGETLESLGNFDAETLSAVACVCAQQLREIGDALAAGRLQRWYLVTEEHAYYVTERAGTRWVAAGEPRKNAEATSKALHRLPR